MGSLWKGFIVCSGLTMMLVAVLDGLPAQAQNNPNPCSGPGDVCALTWQQDTALPAGSACSGCSYRTGENLLEPNLIPSAIQGNNFGQLCSAALDGQVFAQPLVVTDVTMTVNNTQTFYNLVGGWPTFKIFLCSHHHILGCRTHRGVRCVGIPTDSIRRFSQLEAEACGAHVSKIAKHGATDFVEGTTKNQRWASPRSKPESMGIISI